MLRGIYSCIWAIGSLRPRIPKKSIKSHVFYVRIFLGNETYGEPKSRYN